MAHVLTADDLAAPQSRRWTVAKWVGYFALLDLLLLPYFQWIIIPYSLPLVLSAWLLLRPTLKVDPYLVLFLVIALAVIASCVLSVFIPGSSVYLAENVKRAFQLLSSFFYFFYFRWLAARIPLRISPIIVLFIVWFGGLSLLFFVKPLETGEVMRGIYGRLVTSEDVIAEHFRFPYMFTDPNTAAYFFLVASAPLLLWRRSARGSMLVIAIMTVVTFLTQSRGAIIALALMILATIYPPDRLRVSLFNVRKALAVVLIALACYGLLTYMVGFSRETSVVAEVAYARIFEAPEQYVSGGSRFENWQHIAGNLLPLPLGRGYMLFIGGNLEYPHSDLIRLTYSYGWLALIPTLLFFFSRSLSFAPVIIPALMAFMINTLIDEQKLLGLFLSLLAICVATQERQAALDSSAGRAAP